MMENSYETINGNGYLGNNNWQLTQRNASPRFSWLDIRVFYVRISKFEIDDSTPEHLTINHIPLDPNTLLELNGVRANIYSDGITTLLRRDRLDKKSEEVTYVSTDSVRMTGSVRFEVLDKDILLLSGSLDKFDTNNMWSMNCDSDLVVGVGFLKGKHKRGLEVSSPSIEVYVAGCFLGKPIMLTKSLNVNSRRKHARVGVLNSIPEDDKSDNEKEFSPGIVVQAQEEHHPEYKSEIQRYGIHYPMEEYFEGEDGELSFFNAGVRVGVGIGLSVCLGIGIGLGLLVKTYQGTTRTFRRRFF